MPGNSMLGSTYLSPLKTRVISHNVKTIISQKKKNSAPVGGGRRLSHTKKGGWKRRERKRRPSLNWRGQTLKDIVALTKARSTQPPRSPPPRTMRDGAAARSLSPDLERCLTFGRSCAALLHFISTENFEPPVRICHTERRRTFVMQIRSKVGRSAAFPRIRFHSSLKKKLNKSDFLPLKGEAELTAVPDWRCVFTNKAGKKCR